MKAGRTRARRVTSAREKLNSIVRAALTIASLTSASIALFHPSRADAPSSSAKSERRSDAVCAVCTPKCEGKTYCNTTTGKCEAAAIVSTDVDMRSGTATSPADELKLERNR